MRSGRPGSPKSTFTIGLAREVAREGIRINAVAPGLVVTDIQAAGARLSPASSIARTTAPFASESRSYERQTRHPRLPASFAVAAPMPRPPPVMRRVCFTFGAGACLSRLTSANRGAVASSY